MPNSTPAEQRRLDQIEAAIAEHRKAIKPLQTERDNIRARIRMRRARAS